MSERFPDLARRAFSFLESGGYSLTRVAASHVQYETESSIVSISWERRSGELNVSLGLQPAKGDRLDLFSLTDLLKMLNVDAPEARMPFQVSDESKLGPFLDQLAKDLQTFAAPTLAGDRMFYRRLETFRGHRAHQLTLSMELSRIRARAEVAWQKRDFGALIALYGPVEAQLTDSERAKLQYARKHLPTQ